MKTFLLTPLTVLVSYGQAKPTQYRPTYFSFIKELESSWVVVAAYKTAI